MPTEEINSIIFICIDEEHCVPLTEISETHISEEDIAGMQYEKIDFEGEIVLEIEPPKNCIELQRFISVFHPSLPWLSWWVIKYGNNNWRKMHGLPMIRRSHGNSK